MVAYLGEINLFKFLSDIDELSNGVDWGLLSIEKYNQLMLAKEEAATLLEEMKKSLLTRDQPMYSVKQVWAGNHSIETIIRLDSLVEAYPFLTEALVLNNVDEISFLNKTDLISVEIKKVE